MKSLSMVAIIFISVFALFAETDKLASEASSPQFFGTEAPSERKLLDSSVSSDTLDPSIYLRLISPDEQQNSLLNVQTKRMLYLKRNDRWITRLLAKLDRMKFIINSRVKTMSESVTNKLKTHGLSPLIKYHTMYNKMMNPGTNPFLSMNMSNKIMSSPEQQADPGFQQFQKNLHEYANTYADSVALNNSGIFDQESEEKKVRLV